MSLCDFCNKEAKYNFICPQCGNRFCNEHRKPEDHDCQKTLTPREYSAEEKVSPSQILDSSNIDHEPKNEVDEYYNLEGIIDQEPKNEVDEYANLEEIIFTEKNSLAPKSYDVRVKSLVAQLDSIKIPLAILIIVSLLSGALMGILIYPNEDTDNLQQRYEALSEYYTELLNVTQTLQTYYDNLTRQHAEVREEYTLLNSLYSDIVKSNSELKKEYDDIINYQKSMQLASKQTINILPKQNISMTYEIPFSGYMTLNYTADGETYVWVGSTNIEPSFYSRNPQFPYTASDHNFTVPVQPNLLVYFANPDELDSIEITFWISFTY